MSRRKGSFVEQEKDGDKILIDFLSSGQLIFKAPAKFGRGDSDNLGKYPTEIIRIIKAGIDSDFSNGVPGVEKIVFTPLNPYFIDIGIDIYAGSLFKNMT